MQTLDIFSKRIFVTAVSISLVLLSLSAFMLTVQRVTAEPKQVPNLITPSRIGLGVDVERRIGFVGAINADGSMSTFTVAIP